MFIISETEAKKNLSPSVALILKGAKMRRSARVRVVKKQIQQNLKLKAL